MFEERARLLIKSLQAAAPGHEDVVTEIGLRHLEALLAASGYDAGRRLLSFVRVEFPEHEQACLAGLARARDLESNELRISELRALALLEATLGKEEARRVREEGWIVVRSRNGRSYLLSIDGPVFDLSDGNTRCVLVDPVAVPRYDRLIAKYLVIRDRPEDISTLGRR
jgi:hypothetical protein